MVPALRFLVQKVNWKGGNRLKGSVGLRRKPWGSIAGFIAPAVLFYMVFIIYPLVATLITSFHETSAAGAGLIREFVGFKHYVELFRDGVFHIAVKNTFLWAIFGSAMEIISALLFAIIIYFQVPWHRFYRFAWFTPILVSGVIVALIFRWVLNPSWGLLNTVLRGVGLDMIAVDWLGRIDTPIWVIMVIHAWNRFGYYMVIILAGLSSVSDAMLDSASIDGANRVQISFKILIPLIMPIFVTALTISFLGKMRAFDLVWVLTKGGPMHASETVATYIHKRAFTWGRPEFGYPSAMAIGWFIIVYGGYRVLTRFMASRSE